MKNPRLFLVVRSCGVSKRSRSAHCRWTVFALCVWHHIPKRVTRSQCTILTSGKSPALLQCSGRHISSGSFTYLFIWSCKLANGTIGFVCGVNVLVVSAMNVSVRLNEPDFEPRSPADLGSTGGNKWPFHTKWHPRRDLFVFVQVESPWKSFFRICYTKFT